MKYDEICGPFSNLMLNHSPRRFIIEKEIYKFYSKTINVNIFNNPSIQKLPAVSNHGKMMIETPAICSFMPLYDKNFDACWPSWSYIYVY